MRTLFLLGVLALLGFAGYGIYLNPPGCEKLSLDLMSDLFAIYIAPNQEAGGPSLGPANSTAVKTNLTQSVAQPAVVASAAPQPPYPVGYVATLPTASVHVAQLASPPPAPPPRANYPTFTNYHDGLEAAQKNHVPMLVLFTGSDWCPYCQMLEHEVLSTNDFSSFTKSRFVFVTLDDLRTFPMSDPDKETLQALEKKFSVSSFPTLVIVGENEVEKGRIQGYNPGSGPASVIQDLTPFAAR